MARQLARAESMQELLVSELNHRVKNSLATVQALAHQTFRNSTDAKSSLRDFDQRLSTMAQTYTLLGEENWQGASLGQIVAAVLKPYLSSGESRVLMSGPEIGLGPRTALLISMALHELATNAAKYGALSRSGGRIDIVWDMVERAGERQVRLTWRETGGPTVAPPTRRGFGSALIERGFAAQVGGQARIAFDPAGVTCILECPIQ
jgi:two-component sensor histidine kinase